MSHNHIQKIVIVGGGTAGWMAAAALAKFLSPVTKIELVESDQIGTVGVGEATIPQILRFNGMLGLDEADFMRECRATFKLGIEFNNWGHIGESYLHTFGHIGAPINHLDFHHYWLRARQEYDLKSNLWDYSIHHKAAYKNRFAHVPRVGNTSISGLSYAYHFNSGLYGQYLRRYAETLGVKRTEGKVNDVRLDPETGHIQSVTLESGAELSGDFFIDCSGFRALLIGQALGVKYLDWSQWLPMNRAFAVASEKDGPLLPYTKATAHDAGWQWRIPLQNRTGNGHVFASDFVEEDAARATLLDNLDAKPIGEPRLLKFTTGRRETFWHKNCLALGLSSGFMEPLESTSIHLIQANISKFIELFPNRAFSDANTQEYNRLIIKEFDLIRDFLILHYHRTDRTDTEFWNYVRTMDVPDSLKAKMDMFAETALIYKDPDDLFGQASWLQVMAGQGLVPQNFHARASLLGEAQLNELLGNVERIIDQAVEKVGSHQDYIDAYCSAAD
ncbi:tryptophan halogenase family protein [Litorimonas sp. RW-G-Af-16]|uniref:tryptophan halogenase family protein n=1 Tax=Litorimonas sp. RW-G-Af-16 TaxID=3241168 RepID=UPI00390CCE27